MTQTNRETVSWNESPKKNRLSELNRLPSAIDHLLAVSRLLSNISKHGLEGTALRYSLLQTRV